MLWVGVVLLAVLVLLLVVIAAKLALQLFRQRVSASDCAKNDQHSDAWSVNGSMTTLV
jgi:hypothetical protein